MNCGQLSLHSYVIGRQNDEFLKINRNGGREREKMNRKLKSILWAMSPVESSKLFNNSKLRRGKENKNIFVLFMNFLR